MKESCSSNSTKSPRGVKSTEKETMTYPWIPGTIIAEEYKVMRLLGKGGMGDVYLIQREFDGALFALKTISEKVALNTTARINFLRELSTWIGLPEHPNIVSCRYFRTIGQKLALFSEYVDGLSLAEWLQEDSERSFEDKLDISIQIARGLGTAHKHGIIHQDVKPANILVSRDGTVKVTDFGLARAFSRMEIKEFSANNSSSPQITADGMTPKYCSPEQATRAKVSLKTDIYSFGVLLLELVLGNAIWEYGPDVRKIFDEFHRKGPRNAEQKHINTLLNVIGGCLKLRPEDRWRTMSEIEEQLIDAYEEISSSQYQRQMNEGDTEEEIFMSDFSFDMKKNNKWLTPQSWITFLEEQGAGKLKRNFHDQTGTSCSEKTKITMDLEDYEIVHSHFNKLRREDDKYLLSEYARFLSHKAWLHLTGGDCHGAIDIITEAIDSISTLLHSIPALHTFRDMINLLGFKAYVLAEILRYDESEEVYRHIIKILADNPFQNNKSLLHLNLWARYNCATLLMKEGKFHEAISMSKGIIERYEEYYYQTRRLNFLKDLVYSASNRAFALMQIGKRDLSLEYYDKAVYFLELKKEHRDFILDVQFHKEIAWIFRNKANVLTMSGQIEEAENLYSHVLSILESLVYQKKQTSLLKELADSYVCMAFFYNTVHNNQKAFELMQKNVAILENLIFKEGHSHCYRDLARAYMNISEIHHAMKNFQPALQEITRALDILHKLIQEKNWTDLKKELYHASFIKAKIQQHIDPAETMSMLKELILELKNYAALTDRNNTHKLLDEVHMLHQKLIQAKKE